MATALELRIDGGPLLWLWPAASAAIIYTIMAIAAGRGPHDRAAGTVVVLNVPPC
jgi:hypothetical protein